MKNHRNTETRIETQRILLEILHLLFRMENISSTFKILYPTLVRREKTFIAGELIIIKCKDLRFFRKISVFYINDITW